MSRIEMLLAFEELARKIEKIMNGYVKRAVPFQEYYNAVDYDDGEEVTRKTERSNSGGPSISKPQSHPDYCFPCIDEDEFEINGRFAPYYFHRPYVTYTKEDPILLSDIKELVIKSKKYNKKSKNTKPNKPIHKLEKIPKHCKKATKYRYKK